MVNTAELVVTLGLGRLRPDASPEEIEAILVAMVAAGHTTQVREVIDLDEARVLEVAAGPVTRWLDDAQAAPVVAAVSQHYRTHGIQIVVTADELRRVGIADVPELALVLDGADAVASPTFALAPDAVMRLVDIDAALRTWTDKSKIVRRVASLLAIAKQHRLIVSCT